MSRASRGPRRAAAAAPRFLVPLIRPYITAEVKREVCAVLDSGYLTEGPVTRKLENAFKEYIGCAHAIAVTSCTTGLEIALRALGIGAGDEVIVPAFTYPATADAVALVGATAVLVDIAPDTLLLDCEAAQRAITPRTKALLPVSLFGNPLDYDRLDALKRAHRLHIIEDAACAIGAEYRGKKVGRFADISVFSLHPRKFITTGEGGIITTRDAGWARWMNSYKHFGMAEPAAAGRARFERLGTNYKLSSLQAAVGVAQMRHIEELLARRRRLAQRYLDLLAGNRRVTLPVTTAGGRHSWQSFCIQIENRDAVMAAMRRRGLEVQIGSYALHLERAFAPGPHCRWAGELKVSARAYERSLALPLYHGLRFREQEAVVQALKELV